MNTRCRAALTAKPAADPKCAARYAPAAGPTMRPIVIGMLLSAMAVESSPSRIRFGTIDCIAGPPTTKPNPTSVDPMSTGTAADRPCSAGSANSHTATDPDPTTHITLPSRICRAGLPGVGPLAAGWAQDQLRSELHDTDQADHERRVCRVVHHDRRDDAVRPHRDDGEHLAPEQRAEHRVEHQRERAARLRRGSGLRGHPATARSKRSVSLSKRATSVSTSASGQSAIVSATSSRRRPVTLANASWPTSLNTSSHRR